MTSTGRLEAFSDGVLAIIITIMVLEMEVPQGIELTALRPLFPVFVSYVLSFVYLAIYWNNHHHMLHLTPSKRSSRRQAAIPAAFVRPWIAGGLYAMVALMWIVPDRRIERVLSDTPHREGAGRETR